MTNSNPKTISNNQACPCGSGRKYKKCCKAFSVIGSDSLQDSATSYTAPMVASKLESSNESRRAQLVDEYSKDCSPYPLNELMGIATDAEIAELLYPYACKENASAALLTVIIECLKRCRRYQDAAFFCQRLVLIKPTIESWYLVAQVVAHQNDLRSLNIAYGQLLEYKAPPSMLATVKAAMEFCAKALHCAVNTAHTIEAAKNDRFSNILAIHIAVRADDYNLLSYFLLNSNCAMAFNHNSHLWAGVRQIVRLALIRSLKVRTASMQFAAEAKIQL